MNNISCLIFRESVKEKLKHIIRANSYKIDIFCNGIPEKMMDIYIRMRLYYYTMFSNRGTDNKRPYALESHSIEFQRNRKLLKIKHL